MSAEGIDGIRTQTLTRSQFLHAIEVRPNVFVLGHALLGVRWTVLREVKDVLDVFAGPRVVGAWVAEHAQRTGRAEVDLLRTVQELVQRMFLHDTALGDEATLMRTRLETQVAPDAKASTFMPNRGARVPFWTLDIPRGLASGGGREHKMTVIVMGACDVQLAMDLLRDQAQGAGIELVGFATSASDFAFVREQKADAIVIGPNQFFNQLFVLRSPGQTSGAGEVPWNGDLFTIPKQLRPRDLAHFVRAGLAACRASTSCPILLQNIPGPTSTPHGIADRGRSSFLNMAREANLVLADVAQEFGDVFIVDVDNLYSKHGKDRLLDDSVYVWEHLGSTTALRDQWLRKELPPEVAQLDPRAMLDAARPSESFEFERLLANELLKLLMALRGIGRKKLVVCDLDNTLWPGVLAETEAPFGAEPTGWNRSPMSVWLGIHQALRALLQRGVMLACCSKNDEAVVRKYWKYPESSADFLLQMDDFVTHRINWDEKADNLLSIASEVGVGLDAIVFIDDNPIERDKVSRRFPEITVLGENLFDVRPRLLSMSAFEVPVVTSDAAARTTMVKTQVEREKLRAGTSDGNDYLRSLAIQVELGRVADVAALDRIHELVARTNQFNTTGRRYTKDEIRAYLNDADKTLHAMRVQDRFGAQGLVGACFTSGNEIELFVMSCRVIGMGVERLLLSAVLDTLGERHSEVVARFVPTDRNVPARDLFKDSDFARAADTDPWRFRRTSGDALLPRAAADLYTLRPLRF